MDKQTLRTAGTELRRLRETYGMTLEDVQSRTTDRFGDDRILEATLSRIERGNISKPPSLLDAAELGLLYNISPSKLFQLYDLPYVEGEAKEPKELTRARIVLSELRDDPDGQREFLSWLDFACTRAMALHAAKK